MKSTKVITSIGWSSVERICTQGIRFVLSFIIARQLLPSDYGLIAMLSIFMSIAQSFIDSGFARALIQKKDRSQIDYSTVFIFNIGIAIILYGIFLLFSSFIASFYNQPILKELIIWIGLNLIIVSFSTVQIAKLTVEMNFKIQSLAAIIGTSVSGAIAVSMAYNSFGVWTLVWQSLIYNIVYVVILWIKANWTPSLQFSISSFKTLFGFGSKLLAGGLLHTIYLNLYSLVIGKFYNAKELGLFGNANTLAQFPAINVTEIIQKVIYPVQCELQSDDEELANQLIKTIQLVCIFLFPLMIGLAAISEPFVLIILTDKWIASVPLIKILCMAYILDPVLRLNYTYLCAKGRTDYTLKSEFIKKGIAFLILLCSIPLGLNAMCWGLVLYSICDLIIITAFTKKINTNVSFFKELKLMLPILALALVMGSVVYAITFIPVNIWIRFLGALIMGIVVYLILIKIFYKSELKYVCQLLKK